MSSTAPVLVARHAMATRFEIALHGENAASLRASGEEALDEIDRMEAMLSLYRGGSEIARVNREAHERPVRVSPSVFRLLKHARAIWEETSGAFDITIAPLVKCWGFMNGTGAMPTPEAVTEARAKVGMQHLELDEPRSTVRFARPGAMIDLGAIGKGFAIDRAVGLLREAGVSSALIHGGTSTAYALGRGADDQPWKIAITAPEKDASTPIVVVELENESLSVSAVWGRSFQLGQVTYGHIIDPRTGKPAQGALLTAVVLPQATDTDGLSTALLTDPSLLKPLTTKRPVMRALVVQGSGEGTQVTTHGISKTV